MKIIVPILFFTPLFISSNLYTANTDKVKKSSKKEHYILSAYYLRSLEQQSEEHLEILEQLYETVETASSQTLEKLFDTHFSTCERFLGDYLEKPTRTPLLHLAVVRGDQDIIKILLKHKADVNLPDKTFIGNHNTPLHYAAQLKKQTRLTICQLLIEQDAHIDIKNKMGKTPLHIACETSDEPSVAELLICLNANIHVRTSHGLTPLHIAVTKGHLETVKLLLDRGAKPWYTDYRNRTPMRIAKENRARDPNNHVYKKILECLNEHNSFEAFVNDLFNFEEPVTKKRRIDSVELN